MSDPPRRRVVAAPPRRSAAELEAVRVVFEPDPTPEVFYLEGERQAAYERDEWRMVGCHIEADVRIVETAQTLKSGYLWGIESDSEQEYLDEVVGSMWSTLRDVLKTVGIPTSELPLEVDRAWVEWRT